MAFELVKKRSTPASMISAVEKQISTGLFARTPDIAFWSPRGRMEKKELPLLFGPPAPPPGRSPLAIIDVRLEIESGRKGVLEDASQLFFNGIRK